MLDYLYEWIQRVAYYMILVTLIMQATAGEGYRKYIRLFTGIILILFILSPVIRLLGLDGKEFVRSAKQEYEAAAENIEEKIQKLEREADAFFVEERAGEIMEAGGISEEMGKSQSEVGVRDQRAESIETETDETDHETGKIEVGEIRIGR